MKLSKQRQRDRLDVIAGSGTTPPELIDEQREHRIINRAYQFLSPGLTNEGDDPQLFYDTFLALTLACQDDPADLAYLMATGVDRTWVMTDALEDMIRNARNA